MKPEHYIAASEANRIATEVHLSKFLPFLFALIRDESKRGNFDLSVKNDDELENIIHQIIPYLIGEGYDAQLVEAADSPKGTLFVSWKLINQSKTESSISAPWQADAASSELSLGPDEIQLSEEATGEPVGE
jgi:hypothetical protein